MNKFLSNEIDFTKNEIILKTNQYLRVNGTIMQWR